MQDDPFSELDSILDREGSDIVPQKRSSWLPFNYGSNVSRSLHNIHPEVENEANDFEESGIPYEQFATPERRNNNVDDDSSDSEEEIDDEDNGIDEDRIESLEELSTTRGRRWSGLLPKKSKKQKIVDVPLQPLESIAEVEYDASLRGHTNAAFLAKTNSSDYDLDTFLHPRQSLTFPSIGVELPSAATRGASREADIEMKPFSLPSTGPINRNGTFASTSAFIDTDPLQLFDLAKLPVINLDTITDCIEKRFKHDLIYTRCGEILISVNPLKPIDLCKHKYFEGYTENSISETPHLFAVSAQAYKNARLQQQNQVILVSGESGSGKTEAAKYLVRHLLHIAGSENESLRDRIIQINPLLEAFGNAKTVLNPNSSRFAKLLTLSINVYGNVESARIMTYMLDKSRVVYHDPKERTFHTFYALLAGGSKSLLESLHIKPTDKFRITGDFSSESASSRDKDVYQTLFNIQQEVLRLIKLTSEEIQDVYAVVAAILHLGNIEFEETDNDAVVIKNEQVIHMVAKLLQLDVTTLIKTLIERKGRLGKDQTTLYEIRDPSHKFNNSMFRVRSKGKGLDSELFATSWGNSMEKGDDFDSLITEEIVELSRNKTQAEHERDATVKSLYKRLFDWLVKKINISLGYSRNLPSIGILDVCGFENLNVNSFEQLCINLAHEHLLNFMHKTLIEEERTLYIQEGVNISDLDMEGVNNDVLLRMFMERRLGILDKIDEDSKTEKSSDEVLVSKLSVEYGGNGILSTTSTTTLDFRIKHFAAEVSYAATSLIHKNQETLSASSKECFSASGCPLLQDMMAGQEYEMRSVSVTVNELRRSKKSSPMLSKLDVSGVNMSDIINNNRISALYQRFGVRMPVFRDGDLAQRRTQIKIFRDSLSQMITNLRESCPYYVRCIKPNEEQVAGVFDREKVKTQLQYNGVRELARIRAFGFPVRQSKENFKRMYEDLANSTSQSDLFHSILQTVSSDPSQYRVGQTQVLMKETVKTALDAALTNLDLDAPDGARGRWNQTLGTIAEDDWIADHRRMEEEKKNRKSLTEVDKTMERESFKQQANKLKLELSQFGESTLAEPRLAEAGTSASGQDDSTYNSVGGSAKGSQKSTESEISESTTEQTVFEEEPKEVIPPAAWDITLKLPEEEERYDVHEHPILIGIKLVVYIILFIILLGTFIIQKVSFLLLTTSLKSQENTSTDKSKTALQSVIFLFLVVAICIPYVLGWMFAVAKLCFGNYSRPSWTTWIWVTIMENLHTLGLCLLVFRILPNLDIIRSAMLLSAAGILPGLLKVIMSKSDYPVVGGSCLVKFYCQGRARRIISFLVDVCMTLCQISVIPLLIITGYFEDETDAHSLKSDPWHMYEIVGSFLLMSFAYWENFTDGNFFCNLNQKSAFKNTVLKMKFELQSNRHYPYVVSYLLKIAFTVLLGYLLNEDVNFNYQDAFSALTNRRKPVEASSISALFALIVTAFVAFYVSFGACMFQMQVISLAIPALLATPATVGILFWNCETNFLQFLEQQTSSKAPQCLGLASRLEITEHWYHFLFGLAWWLSFFILNRHIWMPKVDRTANMARLFITPNYCGILTCESIMLNRIRNPQKVREIRKDIDEGETYVAFYKLGGKLGDDSDEEFDDLDVPVEKKKEKFTKDDKKNEDENPATPLLYACATMWHETKTEMVQLLKSFHRLDRDQFIRKVANASVAGHDPDFYNFEAHIFFDDAMEPNDDEESVPNSWLKELVSCMDEACSSVHGKPMKVHPPYKVPTPYGGQLIWQMPGENLLFVHMKDVKKIRNRKRWSQVMYMFYLLGYRHIMASKQEFLEKMRAKAANLGGHGLNIREINFYLGEEAAIKSQNTFILALDGDTDFSPGSIKILLDRMKDEHVGAACGRIHPIGNGPMVWYQKFEYAIGHWLQKAAEHVFGCVLCSPGCFSLFRASALMDTNVMKKYTTEPTEPVHHLQYDQGEDRWLCTLLLQRGYRIEYAAAADAWTFAPEGFFEFFNQRRRWMPSTIANILDLLKSASLTTKRNSNISFLYIAYQWLLMLMTVLGPGTILMMIAGAVKLVFDLTLINAYIFATVPAIAFTVICFLLSSQIQLYVAGVLSIFYSFIMLIVFVGTIRTATTEDILHPSVVVIVMLMGIFIVAGMCHPQEIWCLIHGVLYLVTIPSGYLLLVIYSICNLNNISWGTREVPTKAERIEMERKKKEKEELEKDKPKKSFFAKLFNRGEEQIKELTKLVKTLMPQRMEGQEKLGLSPLADRESNKVVELLSKIEKNLRKVLKSQGDDKSGDTLNSVVTEHPEKNKEQPTTEEISVKVDEKEVKTSIEIVPDGKKKKRKKRRDDLKNPAWSEDRGLGNGEIILGNKTEMMFWADFIEKYLKPIRPTEKEKKDLADGLRDLRSNSVFALVILNLLWMSLNFMFQLTNAARFTITYGPHSSHKIEESVLGLAFVMLLMLLLVIQMVGMFIHRFGTLQQLLAITEISLCKGQQSNTAGEGDDLMKVIKHIKEVLKIPLAGDVGTETVPPPLPTNDDKNWGVTIARSNRNLSVLENQGSNLRDLIGKTMMNRSLLPHGRTISSQDVRKPENMIMQKRFLGGRLTDDNQLEKSFRPRLPPRTRDSHLHHNMVMQANIWGLTQRDIEKYNIPVDREELPDSNLPLGALGKSLYQRTKLLSEVLPASPARHVSIASNIWNDSDVNKVTHTVM